MEKDCRNCAFDSESMNPVCMTCVDGKKRNNFVDKGSKEGKKIIQDNKKYQKEMKEGLKRLSRESGYGTTLNGKFVDIKPEKEITQDIHNALSVRDKRIDQLEKENERLKKGLLPKPEFIDRTAPLTKLTKVEQIEDKKFRDKHYKKCKNPGKYWYWIEGTGLGDAIKIKCPICGEEKDITDMDKF